MRELTLQAEAAAGPRYLELELRARQQAASDPIELAALREHLADDDPVVALMAHVVLDWLGDRRGDYEAALVHLKRAPERAAQTPKGTPSPLGVASYLTLHFSNRLTKLLALRLLKETDWDRWKVVAILLYLKEHKDPATTGALLRFAIETNEDTWRGFALEAVQAIADPRLTNKLAFEEARAKKLGRPVPATVQNISRGAR